jgi:hypothetical protein
MDDTNIRRGGSDDALPHENSASPRRPEPRPYDDGPPLRRVVDIHRRDRQQLTLLAVFHFVVAVVLFLLGSTPVFFIGLGLAMEGPPHRPDDQEMVAGFCLSIIPIWGAATVAWLVGLSLHKRKRRMLCLVVAGLECLLPPFGTILGIFTLTVLMRESVENLFAPGVQLPADPDD